jgi:alpha-D-ribose 1-methylphosphonate 5-triphosphate synthase subunit PhnL
LIQLWIKIKLEIKSEDARDVASTAVVVKMLREVKGKTTMIGIFHDLIIGMAGG